MLTINIRTVKPTLEPTISMPFTIFKQLRLFVPFLKAMPDGLFISCTQGSVHCAILPNMEQERKKKNSVTTNYMCISSMHSNSIKILCMLHNLVMIRLHKFCTGILMKYYKSSIEIVCMFHKFFSYFFFLDNVLF